MPQGISPNPLNKLSQIYLSQIVESGCDCDCEGCGQDPCIKCGRSHHIVNEHHKKDADGNTIPHEGEDVDEAMYTGPNKEDRKLIKKTDDPSYAKKLADYEKNMDPKKRQALKDKATKGMKFTHEAFSDTGMAKGSGKPSGAMKDFLDKKAKKLEKQRASQSQAARNNPHFDSTQPSPSGRNKYMESISNWREDFIWEEEVEGPDNKDNKKVTEKNIKNKIVINPKLGEAVESMGGQLIDVVEMDMDKKGQEDPQMKSKMLRQRQLKKQVLLRKLQAVRQTGGEDIVASYEPDGEQLDEYGNPRVGMRLKVARAIDKVNPKPKVGSKRTAISNKLKMSSIRADTRRQKQKDNPYSVGKKVKTALGMSTEDYIPEEEYDHYKDRMAERGIDISSPDKKDATTMPRKPEKPSKGMTAAQKAAKGKSALDIVKADIRKKYGKGAIMDMGKK